MTYRECQERECVANRKRIAELEAEKDDIYQAAQERTAVCLELEAENKRLKEQLAESEAELISLLDSEGLLEPTDE